MIALLAVALAGAPARPEPPAPVDGECARAIPLERGHALPAALVRDGEAACSGVVVGDSSLADLLATEAWGEQTAALYDLDVPACEARRDALAAELARPVPLLRRPGVALAGGVVVGAGAVLLGAWAVGEVTHGR